MKKLAFGGLCALTLAGCAVGPDYVRPAVPASGQFKESKDWQPAQPADQLPKGAWWQVFGDPDLNRLEEQLVKSNLTIAQAEAQVRQSAALLGEAQAAYYPTLGATASESRGRTQGSNGLNPVGKTYSTGLSASWEVDLWGEVRRNVEAGRAKEASDQALLENARLSEEAQLAITYFELYVADGLKRSLDQSVQAYQTQLTITQNRYAAGTDSLADVASVQNALQTTMAEAADEGLQRAKLEHSIAVLIGQTPAGFSLPERTRAPHMPAIPAALPSELLERRPDIASAERLVAEANAQVGVARAAWFPQLTLGASGGYASSALAGWIASPNRIWSVGPSLALSVFDGGLRSAQNAAAEANYDQTVASYRQTVLSAFQAVEDNLAAQRILAQEAGMQHLAVQAARQSTRVTENQYKAGTVDLLSLAQAQVNQQASERSELAVLDNQLAAAVGLIEALGGGYRAPQEEGQ